MKPSEFRQLVIKNRTFRRFYQELKVKRSVLRQLVDIARFSPSGANMQPLKYYLSSEPKCNKLIFDCLAWAGYLKDWPGPDEGERPSAYIIILADNKIAQSPGCDHGIAAQNIMLGAASVGLGGCIVGSVRRADLQKTLKIPARFSILLVLAIGKPKEKVVVERSQKESIKYWRDSKGVHHVPKRALKDVIIGD